MIDAQDLVYARKLKQLRLRSGHKQLAMANHLHLSGQQVYSQLECGKLHFTPKLLADICRFFDISLEDLSRDDGGYLPPITNSHGGRIGENNIRNELNHLYSRIRTMGFKNVSISESHDVVEIRLHL